MRPDNDQQNNDKHTQERQEQNAQAHSEQAEQGQARQDQDAPGRSEPSTPERRQVQPNMPAASAAPAVVSATPNVCARLTPDLKAYQDGQMGWRQKWSVGRHLTRCAACREELEAMREFSDRWRGADAEVLDPALRARILAAVPDIPPAAPARSAASRPRPLLLAGAAVSAAIGAIVLYPMVVKYSDNAPDASKATDIAPSSAPAAVAGLAQSRREGYAAAPAAKIDSAAANPAGTQIADARQFPGDSSGGASGDLERTARDGAVDGNTSGLNGSNSAQATAVAGAASPTASATEATAGSAAPAASGVPGGSAMPMPAMGKASAPPSPPSLPAPSTKAASDPFKASDRQAAANSSPPKPDVKRSLNSAAKVVQPARIADGLPADKTAPDRIRQNKAAAAAEDATKIPGSRYATPAYARPSAARRAGSTEANSMQADADMPGVTLKIRVEHVESAAADIEKHTRAIGGIVVVSETTTQAGGAKFATLKLKAPTAGLDALVAQIGRTGTVLSQIMPSTRFTIGDNATHANSLAAQARNESQKQTVATTNITVLLQSR